MRPILPPSIAGLMFLHTGLLCVSRHCQAFSLVKNGRYPTLGSCTSNRLLWSRLPSKKQSAAEDGLVERQKSVSDRVIKDQQQSSLSSEKQHNKHQETTFDKMASYFANNRNEMIPDDLIPVYQHLANQVVKITTTEVKKDQEHPLRILDGACGTGALFSFLESAGACRIVGVDMSSEMIREAKRLLEETAGDHNVVSVVHCNLLEYGEGNAEANDGARFDSVVLNACFGNFWNQTAVLERSVTHWLCDEGAVVFVTHPLGADFVQRLHEEDTITVPHVLPADRRAWAALTRYLPLELIHLETQFAEKPFYFAALRRVRHRCLPQTIRLRGQVATGFGRGGKKLGFPTANLNPPDFRQALLSVPTGVYFGWSLVERKGAKVLPAVVNVGVSPTFAGKKNAEMIVEAHIIVKEEDERIADFYNETMRLQLHGFLRNEKKFPSFPELIAQITADRDEAQHALQLEEYLAFQQDPFLSKKAGWVGQDGGDDKGSWEFVDPATILDDF